MLLKRVVITVVGGTVLLFGLALLVLPGPAFLVIPIGLAILATEFVWARRWLRRAKGMVDRRKAGRTTRALGFAFRRRGEHLLNWVRARLGLAIRRSRPRRTRPADPAAAGTGAPPGAGGEQAGR
jgi:tellurite resistance protein TerC